MLDFAAEEQTGASAPMMTSPISELPQPGPIIEETTAASATETLAYVTGGN